MYIVVLLLDKVCRNAILFDNMKINRKNNFVLGDFPLQPDFQEQIVKWEIPVLHLTLL